MRALPPVALADSHVHLDRYRPEAVSAMLARARRVGVRDFLAIGVDLATSRAAVALARRRRGLRAAVGIHPTRVGDVDFEAAFPMLSDLAQQSEVAAIGEVGLDDSLTAPPLEVQEGFFERFLDLASKLGLAVSLHIVGLHQRTQELLARRGAELTDRTVVHYFQGDRDLAASYLALGCSISVGKPVTRAERPELRAAVSEIPLDRLLLETDTYPLPGRTTEPRDVAAICRAVAELRGEDDEVVARATSENYRRIFLAGRS